MITVAYDNVWARIVSHMSKDERQELREILGCMIPGYEYSEAYINGHWDGITSFFRYGKFPAGLMSLVKKAKPDTKFIDQRPPNQSLNKPLNIIDAKLRDYQEEAVRVFLENERGIIKLATRSGKTFIAASVTQILGKKTLFITHLKNLLEQTRTEYLNRFGIDAGHIGGGQWKPEHVTVATFQTFSKRLKGRDADTLNFLHSVEFVVFDEVHRASKEYQDISRCLVNARWRLGLSATACLTNEFNAMSSQALTGPIIYDIPISDLVDRGMVARPTVRFLDIKDKANIPKHERGDWTKIYDRGIVSFDIRNELIADTAVALVQEGKSVLVLVDWKSHGRILRDLVDFRANVKFMCGDDKAPDRKKAIIELQTHRLDVLVSTGIFNEGVDIPGLDAVIVATGGESPISLYQRYGRSMTKTSSKHTALIVDFIDRSHRNLLRQSEDRRTIVENDPAFEVITFEVKKKGRTR